MPRGVIYHSQWCVVQVHGVSYRHHAIASVPDWRKYIHIGVGSDVVCSTAIGNARASIRGTDNRTISRFFFVSAGKIGNIDEQEVSEMNCVIP